MGGPAADAARVERPAVPDTGTAVLLITGSPVACGHSGVQAINVRHDRRWVPPYLGSLSRPGRKRLAFEDRGRVVDTTMTSGGVEVVEVPVTSGGIALALEVTVDAVGAVLTVRDAAGEVVARVEGTGSLLGKLAGVLVAEASST